MKRMNIATRVVLAAATGLLLFFVASSASAQSSPVTSTSSLGCLPPNLVGQTVFSGFESIGAIPDNRQLCRRYCQNIFTLCKHSVGSQNQCVRRLIRNLRGTGRTICRDESDPQDIRDCTASIQEEAAFLWDVNRDAVSDGLMYCTDLRVSCQEDCDFVL